ncbi:MAG: SDR family NAD(P)-dependent oxidoreductase, partial [Chlorobiales bacterium]|nr:SDR family NAD(P)-dependent oxidoreductase [Chlorobiales bacterium]
MGYTLITGASSGIGEGFAKEYARRGSDLIISARSEEKLMSLA